MKWITGSGPHGVWLGINEVRKRELVASVVKGGVFYDVGAHVGSYTMLAKSATHVTAYEPNPRNLRYLYEHIRLNNLRNVEVVEAAVSDSAGTAPMSVEETGLLGSLGGQGMTVSTVTLDGHPDCIKIDVEGGELAVLRGAEDLLSDRRPTLFVALHGDQPGVLELIGRHGYHVREIEPGEIMATR